MVASPLYCCLARYSLSLSLSHTHTFNLSISFSLSTCSLYYAHTLPFCHCCWNLCHSLKAFILSFTFILAYPLLRHYHALADFVGGMTGVGLLSFLPGFVSAAGVALLLPLGPLQDAIRHGLAYAFTLPYMPSWPALFTFLDALLSSMPPALYLLPGSKKQLKILQFVYVFVSSLFNRGTSKVGSDVHNCASGGYLC